MDCPKCGFALDADPAECNRCGVVIAKFRRGHQESLESAVELLPLLQPTHAAVVAPENESAARSERIARAVALPAALLLAWLAVRFTPVSAERSPTFTVLLMGLLAYGGHRAWQLQRWFWVVASASHVRPVRP